MPVKPVQVRGEVWYAVPWIGRLNILFSADQHELMTRVAAGGCFAYAIGAALPQLAPPPANPASRPGRAPGSDMSGAHRAERPRQRAAAPCRCGRAAGARLSSAPSAALGTLAYWNDIETVQGGTVTPARST